MNIVVETALKCEAATGRLRKGQHLYWLYGDKGLRIPVLDVITHSFDARRASVEAEALSRNARSIA